MLGSAKGGSSAAVGGPSNRTVGLLLLVLGLSVDTSTGGNGSGFERITN